MTRIEMIKDLQGKGLGPVAISERLGLDRKTVSKYMAMEIFEEGAPKHSSPQNSSKLDAFKPMIREWLEEGRIARIDTNSGTRPHESMCVYRRSAPAMTHPIHWFNDM